MSRNLPRFLLIFSLALNLGFLLFFLLPHLSGHGPFPPGPPRGMVTEVLESLSLSAEDEEAMKQLMSEFEGQVFGIERTIQGERLKALELLADPVPLDEAALRLSNEKLQGLYDQRFEIFLDHAKSMEALIGPELRAEFHAILLEQIKNDPHGPGGRE